MPSEIPPYWYFIFIVATAISVVIQGVILLSLGIALLKLRSKVEHILNHVTDHALPLIASSKATLDELSPKLKVISSNLVDISETLKRESQTIKVSVDDVLEKTRVQTARVDEMVSGTLDGISHASATIQHGISVPLRQIGGLVNGFRAGLHVLFQKDRIEKDRPVRTTPVVVAEEPVVPGNVILDREPVETTVL